MQKQEAEEENDTDCQSATDTHQKRTLLVQMTIFVVCMYVCLSRVHILTMIKNAMKTINQPFNRTIN